MSTMESKEIAFLRQLLEEAAEKTCSLARLRARVQTIIRDRKSRMIIWTYLIDGELVFYVWPNGKKEMEQTYRLAVPRHFLVSAEW